MYLAPQGGRGYEFSPARLTIVLGPQVIGGTNLGFRAAEPAVVRHSISVPQQSPG